ncbi:NUDIX domain-containing protein [Paenibacillus flagellatus]|uniref:NUDIX hydrolase n=1 Tax=Paenibacillus flagellatus TaxID=2211139 RepID=A0A2V5KTL5_9BACL|nr:NUDIX domain-containing protein [Paenibacillus flagellatus]PYI55107.1 NUDIX hydrolase [Paenibacillus flagellatus]
MKPIRNSAKAIIRRDGKLLLTKNKDAEGYFFLFPGGGQEPGEQLSDAVVRECIEETGRTVSVGELVHVREYIGKNHQFAEWDSDIHQVEFYFLCELTDAEERAFDGHNPDSAQVGVEWIEIDRLDDIRLYPQTLIGLIRGGSTGRTYLGDAN